MGKNLKHRHDEHDDSGGADGADFGSSEVYVLWHPRRILSICSTTQTRRHLVETGEVAAHRGWQRWQDLSRRIRASLNSRTVRPCFVYETTTIGPSNRTVPPWPGRTRRVTASTLPSITLPYGRPYCTFLVLVRLYSYFLRMSTRTVLVR